MTHLGVWLAIVDGEHARFVMHDVHGFHTIRTKAPDTAGQRTAELVTDRLGRSFESVGIARHAIASHSDPHLREKEHFAARIAPELNAAAAQSLFTRLILAGPSRTLQAVEEALDPGVRRGRVAKSLVKVPDQDLGEHFPAWPLVL
jgi:protein required for attachment to host cells